MTTDELRALDAEVHTKVFGPIPEFDCIMRHFDGSPVPFHLPHYSTDIAAAWSVAESLCGPDYRGCRIEFCCGQCWCYFHTVHAGTILGQATEPTAPLAICRAALKAISFGA